MQVFGSALKSREAQAPISHLWYAQSMAGDIEAEELTYEPVPEGGFERTLWALLEQLRRSQATQTIE